MVAPNLQSSDYYQILGCPRNANDAALKKAYRKLAVKWHPDKNLDNKEATENFQKVSEAFATLSDPKQRRDYDQCGMAEAPEAGGMPAEFGAFGGIPGGMPAGGAGGMHHMNQEEAQQFFSQAFGGSDPFGGFFGGTGGGGSGGSGMGGMGGGPGASFVPPFGGSGQGGPGGNMDPLSMFVNQDKAMGGGVPGGMPGMSVNMGGFGPGGMLRGQPGMQCASTSSSSMRQQQVTPSSAPQYDVIPPGTIVSLKGLVKASNHNGDRGSIGQYLPSTGRYVVELEDSDDVDTLSVKPENLLQHVHVRIRIIVSQPELNGRIGTIITWAPSKGRYNIYVSDLKRVVSLKPGNAILANGTVARVSGLGSRPELNGKWGTIKDWIQDSNKYDVQLSVQQIIRVKVENMML